MTWTEVLIRIRGLLNDHWTPWPGGTTDTSCDWPNSELMRYASDGLSIIMQDKPEARTSEAGDEVVFAEVTDADLGKECSLPRHLIPALVHYVCAQAFSSDEGDKYDADRSANHFERFERMMGLGKP